MSKDKNKYMRKLIAALSSFEGSFASHTVNTQFRSVVQGINRLSGEILESFRRSEAEAAKSRQEYMNLVDNIDLGITLIDDHYRIHMINSAHGNYYRKGENKFLNKFCFRELAKREGVCPTCPGTIAMSTGRPAVVEDEGVRDDGSSFAVRIKAFPVFDADGKARKFIEVVEDITERRMTEQKIEKLAYFDSLTHLPNRALLKDRLNQLVAHARRNSEMLGVLFIDLDRFKGINDTKGHAAGDHLLKVVARRLRVTVRANDTIARLGGDEFVVAVPEIGHEQDLAHVAQKLLKAVSEPFSVDGKEIFTTASIGIAVYPSDGETAGQLLRHADTAMYAAKGEGRNSYRFFSSEMNRIAVEAIELEDSLRRALDRDELFLVYQPQIDVEEGSVTGVEALLRWRHPVRGMVPPEQFIPVAEDAGLIVPLGQWVLRTACSQLRSWHDQGFTSLRLAVNISGVQFKQENFVAMVEEVLRDSHLNGDFLELEITESVLMASGDQTVGVLRKLKQLGVTLAIDDFGTGYSSLNYLKNFPIDRLKIDKTFMGEIGTNSKDAAITEAIIVLGRSLGVAVIAEGVEKPEQQDFLTGKKCREMQGHLFSRPMHPDELVEFLVNGTALSA